MFTKEIMTPEQVAEYLQLDPTTIYRYIKEGKLFASKIGRQYRVPKESVDMLLMLNAVPKGIRLRRYSIEQIEDFIREDQINDETRNKALKLLRNLGLDEYKTN
ncbi:MAG: helix-turn-helix domain-containing protein [Actinobacteria bacterium]|nr:helix-turn-helix domain-containing protein [Actinomycetota bacterium]